MLATQRNVLNELKYKQSDRRGRWTLDQQGLSYNIDQNTLQGVPKNVQTFSFEMCSGLTPTQAV